MISLKSTIRDSGRDVTGIVVSHLILGSGALCVVCKTPHERETIISEVRDALEKRHVPLVLINKTILESEWSKVMFVMSASMNVSMRGWSFVDIMFTRLDAVLTEDAIESIHRIV